MNTEAGTAMMRLLLLLMVAGLALACRSAPADESESAATRPAARRSQNGVLRDPVGDKFVIEGTVRGQTTVR